MIAIYERSVAAARLRLVRAAAQDRWRFEINVSARAEAS